MTDEAKLYRCMGGNRCNHMLGTCTATNAEYQAKAKAKQSMTDEAKALVERATRRAAILHASAAWGSDEDGALIDRLLDLIETQAREIERLKGAVMDCWLKNDEPTTVDAICRAALGESHE